MNFHPHSVLDDFQMLRDYATRHALASQKGQRETVASVQTVPRKQGRDPPENTATQATERVGGEARTALEKCVICFEYHMTEPHKLEHLTFAAICCHLGSLKNLKYRSIPMRMFCCKQYIHDRCLYTFLATQYGYAHAHQRKEWRCPHCRTSLILMAS